MKRNKRRALIGALSSHRKLEHNCELIDVIDKVDRAAQTAGYAQKAFL